MGKLEDRVAEAGQLLGLPPRLNARVPFGVKDSFPVQLSVVKKGDFMRQFIDGSRLTGHSWRKSP